jgi:predicted peptidase
MSICILFNFRKNPMKKFLLAFALLFLSLQIFAQGVFEKKSFVNEAGQSLSYQILFPVNYDPSIKYPVVLVLHGAGERGDDNVAQMKYGTQVFLNPENQQKFPAIVIFPQCPKDSYWSSVKIDRTQKPTEFIFDYSQNINWPLQSAVDLVKSLVKTKVADKKRLYIMGLSMGGMGTMEAVSRNPKMFAAAIPICGGADLTYVKKYAKKLPLWVNHGDADSVVPVKHSSELVAALQEAGANVTYTEYPGVNHNSWDNTFAQPTLLSWLFSFKK